MMKFPTSVRFQRMLLSGVSICAISLFSLGARAEEKVKFDIKPQALSSALDAFGVRTHRQILFTPALTADKTTAGISGELDTDAALAELLAGTGLTFSDSDGTILIVQGTAGGGSPPPGGGSTATHPNRLGAARQASPSEASGTPSPEEIVVTAQKREERLKDVPMPVSVLSAKSLVDNNQVLIKDYFSTIPAFYVSPNFAGQQMLSIRGITTGGFTNPTVAILVDDVPFGTSTFWAGNQVPDIDPSDLARLEVLRGPQGTLYGVNSMSGLVKYVTIDPSTEGYSGRISIGTSSVYNEHEPGYNLRGSANVPFTDTLAIRISAYRRQDSGYLDNPVYNLRGVNQAEAYGGRLSVMWRPSDDFSVKFNALYQNIRADGSQDVDIEPGLGDLQQNYINGIGGYNRTIQLYDLTVKANLRYFDIVSVTSYGINRYTASLDWSSVVGAAVQSIYGVGSAAYIDHNNITKFTQELRFSGSIWQDFDWLVGGFYTHEDAPDSEIAPVYVPATGQIVGQYWTGTFPTTYEEYAAFADLTYRITDQLDIQIGARESRIETADLQEIQTGPLTGSMTPVITPAVSSSASAFTYLVTPRWKISPDVMIYGRFASGYRPGGPQAGALIAQGAPPKYNPDETDSYEIGLKGDFFDHRLSIDTSLYYIDWNDIQINLQTKQGFQYNSNGSHAKSEGFEFSVESRPLTGLTAAAWIAYDNAVLTQAFPANGTAYGVPGSRLPNTPGVSANVSLQQDFPLWKDTIGFVGGMVSYIGDRVSVFTNTSQRQVFPAYTKLDLRAGVSYESWTANFFVNNATDVRGVLNGGIGFDPHFAFVYIQPRTIGLTLSRTF